MPSEGHMARQTISVITNALEESGGEVRFLASNG